MNKDGMPGLERQSVYRLMEMSTVAKLELFKKHRLVRPVGHQDRAAMLKATAQALYHARAIGVLPGLMADVTEWHRKLKDRT